MYFYYPFNYRIQLNYVYHDEKIIAFLLYDTTQYIESDFAFQN